LLPTLAGLSGEDYQSPTAYAAGYRTAILIAAGLLAAGGLLSATLIRNEPIAAAADSAGGAVGPAGAVEQTELSHCFSCPVDGPRLETVQRARGRP
jgi:hypothetical protein